MRRILETVILLAWIATLPACLSSTAQDTIAAAEHFDHDWALHGLWNQGKAEVAQYQAQRTIYGKPRHFEYTFILVKETFNREFKVKTDNYDRNDLFEVMKINKFARIPTDNYPYHYMTSIFYERGQPSTVYKLVNSSQEWCGTTTKYFLHTGRRYVFGYQSYWDGQGVGEMTLEGNIMFEDQLTHSLRALNFSDGLAFQQRVAESQVNSQVTAPTIYNATFNVAAVESVPLRTDYVINDQVWKVTVQLDSARTNEYWFDRAYPNILLKQITWDGRNLDLIRHAMDDYWVIKEKSAS